MHSITQKLTRGAGLLMVGGMFLGLVGSASAATQTTQSFQANLTPVNSSNAYGTFTVRLNGNMANISGQVNGVAANLPHAQHFHWGDKASHSCPSADAKGVDGGLLTTLDAAPQYGAVDVSLTKSGDTGPKSALDVTRFPIGSAQGDFTYNNSIKLTDTQVQHLKSGQYVVVVHGVDADKSGAYDGAAKSSLDPSLPLEATAPVACGVMTAETTSTVIKDNGELASTNNNGPAVVAAIALGALGTILGIAALATRSRN